MHRDIEPENLIFTHDWQRKVTDVDIAQVLIIAETMAAFGGASVETPAYM
jgi:serine/threonine protein kinase